MSPSDTPDDALLRELLRLTGAVAGGRKLQLVVGAINDDIKRLAVSLPLRSQPTVILDEQAAARAALEQQRANSSLAPRLDMGL